MVGTLLNPLLKTKFEGGLTHHMDDDRRHFWYVVVYVKTSGMMGMILAWLLYEMMHTCSLSVHGC